MYESCVLTGARDGTELTLIERYVGVAREIDRMQTAVEFAVRFGELARVSGQMGVPADLAVQRVFEMYKRHATQVLGALAAAVSSRSVEMVRLELPPTCLLGIAVGTVGQEGGGDPHSVSTRPVADRNTFSIQFSGQALPLGNTIEFDLFERLLKARGHFISHGTLEDDVWHKQVQKNTIQCHVSNLRRKLNSKWPGLFVINGKVKGNYSLKVQP